MSMLSVSSYQPSTSRRADSNPLTQPEFSGASIIQRSEDSIDLTENADNSLSSNELGRLGRIILWRKIFGFTGSKF